MSLKRGSFTSEGSPSIGGTWGLHDATPGLNHGTNAFSTESKGGTEPVPLGTHLWLRIDREKSEEVLGEGIAGLQTQQSFSLLGEPVLDSFEAELSARALGGGVTDRVDGHAILGSRDMWANENWWGGEFSLIRTKEEIPGSVDEGL